MAAKDVLFGDDARVRMARGVNILLRRKWAFCSTWQSTSKRQNMQEPNIRSSKERTLR